jgi:hypothetical protein
VAGRRERIEYRSRFLDIAAGERIVLSYSLALDGIRRWVSLVTVELAVERGGTRLQLNGLAAVVRGEVWEVNGVNPSGRATK